MLHHTLERSAICTPVPRASGGNACTQVRARDSDFDRKRPRISDGCVFTDAGIRRAAAERRACDKSGIKLSMTSVRLQLMNVCVCVCACSCELSKTTPGTHGPHHEDILDFNVHVGSFKIGFLGLFFSSWLLGSFTLANLWVFPEDYNLDLSTYKYVHTHAYTCCYLGPYRNPNYSQLTP